MEHFCHLCAGLHEIMNHLIQLNNGIDNYNVGYRFYVVSYSLSYIFLNIITMTIVCEC